MLDVILECLLVLTSNKDEFVQRLQEVYDTHWKHTINYLAPGKEIQEMD